MESKETHGSVGGASTSSSSSSSSKKKQSKRPKYSRFSQQELPACKFIITPTVVIATFVAIAIVFIPLGLASLFASDHVVEIVHRYDNLCLPESSNAVNYIQSKATNKTCAGKLTVSFEFYPFTHRYVKSRSDKQLKSKEYARDTKSCAPEANTDKGPIIPCGLVAWSLFNDTYKFVVKNKVLDINKKNIAWESDKNHKFGSDVYPQNFQSGGLIGGAMLEASKPLSEQEDLMVWMRTAALPTFRKLYGRIEGDLQVNDIIELVVENNYNTYSFGGKKWLILSTTSWIGGKNEFLGIAYLTIGGLCLFLAVTFILIYVLRPRQLGDPSYLSWNKQPREP
ncbi:ALA-interacting subunit 5 [Linum perenne]